MIWLFDEKQKEMWLLTPDWATPALDQISHAKKLQDQGKEGLSRFRPRPIVPLKGNRKRQRPYVSCFFFFAVFFFNALILDVPFLIL